MTVIHLGTEIVTHYGKLDDQGNVVEVVPIKVSLKIVNQASFAEALALVLDQKAKLGAMVNPRLITPDELLEAANQTK